MKSINEQIGAYLRQLEANLNGYEIAKSKYDIISEESYKHAKESDETDWSLVNEESYLYHNKQIAIRSFIKSTKSLAKLTGYTFSSTQLNSMKHGYEFSSKDVALKVQSFAEELKTKISNMQSDQEQFNY